MKKYLTLAFILLLAFALHTYAGMVICETGGGGGGGCSTLRDDEAGADTGYTPFAGEVGTQYIAVKFVPTASYTICKVEAYLARANSPGINMTMYIFSHDAAENDPDTEISGTNSSAVASTSVETTFGYILFADMSYAVTADTTYWIVIGCSGYGDPSNYMKWGEADDDGGPVVERICTDGDASGTWTLAEQYKTGKHKVYSD